MNAEAQRQQALVEAVLGRSDALGLAALPGVEGGIERGLSAYRLNAKAVAAKALASVFPRVIEWLGEDDFAAMAWAFWRQRPPERGDLGCWGEALAEFLDAQPGMEKALSDSARLDWACHQAERAADGRVDGPSLALLACTEPARLRLRLMPGLSLLRLDRPVLVWRKDWVARHQDLSGGEAAFIEALLASRDLEQALALALAADPLFDFSAWLQAALTETWLQAASDKDPP